MTQSIQNSENKRKYSKPELKSIIPKPSSGVTYGKYAIALVTGIGVGMLSAYFAIHYGFKPVAIYEQNLNNDNIPDKVIMLQRNNQYGFIENADGSYSPIGLLEKKVLKEEKTSDKDK